MGELALIGLTVTLPNGLSTSLFIFAGPALLLGWRRLRDRGLLRFFAGAAVAGVLLVSLSLVVSGGPSVYREFVQNTLKHESTPLTNDMGLRTLVAWRPHEPSIGNSWRCSLPNSGLVAMRFRRMRSRRL